jgi:hypothetical protein
VERSEHFQPVTPLRVRLQTDQGAIEVEAQVAWTEEMTLHTPSGPLTAEGVVVWVGQQDQRMPGESLWHGLRFTAIGWTTSLSLGLFLVEPV